MEYIEMSGAAMLKHNHDVSEIDRIIQGLHAIEFVGAGCVNTYRKDNLLSVECAGEISDIYDIKLLLEALQQQLSDTSMIVFSKGKWDTSVILTSFTPTANLELEPIDHLKY